MKKLIFPALVVAVVALFFFLNRESHDDLPPDQSLKSVDGFDGKVHFQTANLPAGVVARSGDYEITEKELLRMPATRAFDEKKRTILFVLIYRQYISYSDKKVSRLELSFEDLGRSLASILSQYGLPQKPETKIQFSAFSPKQGLAKVDGLIIQESDVDFTNILWSSYQTELYRYQLKAVDKLLKQKYVNGEAKKLKMSVPAYQKKYIYDKISEEVSESDILDYMKKYNMKDEGRNRRSVRSRLQTLRKQRGLNYILEKYVMELPIQVSLKKPRFNLETNWDWTPRTGDKQGLSMTLFSDTRNSVNQDLIPQLLELIPFYKTLNLSYRPIFFENDRYQNMISQMQFCVWLKSPNMFWSFFTKSLGDFKENTEKKLYKISNDLGLDTSAIKKCFIEQNSKEVVSYHVQYAKYLGIETGPVLVVGDEVLRGGIRLEDVEDIIQRQLRVPAAGVWKRR